jgi:hypothetical protein
MDKSAAPGSTLARRYVAEPGICQRVTSPPCSNNVRCGVQSSEHSVLTAIGAGAVGGASCRGVATSRVASWLHTPLAQSRGDGNRRDLAARAIVLVLHSVRGR